MNNEKLLENWLISHTAKLNSSTHRNSTKLVWEVFQQNALASFTQELLKNKERKTKNTLKHDLLFCFWEQHTDVLSCRDKH